MKNRYDFTQADVPASDGTAEAFAIDAPAGAAPALPSSGGSYRRNSETGAIEQTADKAEEGARPDRRNGPPAA
jgi:hypothetical protein